MNSKLKNKYLPDSIEGKNLVSPIKLEPKVDLKSTLETYALTASDGQLVYASDTEEFFGVTGGFLKKLDFQAGYDIVNSAALNNNVSTFTQITSFNVSNSDSFDGFLKVKVTADEYKTEAIDIQGDYNGTDWDITIESINDSDVEFDVDSSGFLVYKTPNYSGFVNASVEFRVRTSQVSNASVFNSLSATAITYNDQNNSLGQNVVHVQEAIQILDSQLDNVENKVETEMNFFERLDFINVSTITVNYGSYPTRPTVETWILEGGVYCQAEPIINYDTTSEVITVDFNNNYKTGYLILK